MWFLDFPGNPMIETPCFHFTGARVWSLVGGLRSHLPHRVGSQVPLVLKNPPANAGDTKDTGSVPKWGRSPGVGNGNPLQYSYPENSMDRGTWQATVHRVTKSQTQLNTHTHTHTHWSRGIIGQPQASWGCFYTHKDTSFALLLILCQKPAIT